MRDNQLGTFGFINFGARWRASRRADCVVTLENPPATLARPRLARSNSDDFQQLARRSGASCRRKPARPSRSLPRFAGWRDAGAARGLCGAVLTAGGIPNGALMLHDSNIHIGYCNRYKIRYSGAPVHGRGGSALRSKTFRSAEPLEIPVYRTTERQQAQMTSPVATSPDVSIKK